MTVSFYDLQRQCINQSDQRVIRSKNSTVSYIDLNIENFCTEQITKYGQKALLRSEVPFERWYFHYEPASSTKGLNHLLSRIWALAYTIESTVKYLITSPSLYYYHYRISHTSPADNFYYLQKYDTLKYVAPTQGKSSLLSLLAVISPETAKNIFKSQNTPEALQKRISKPWGTMYAGKSALSNVISTY